MCIRIGHAYLLFRMSCFGYLHVEGEISCLSFRVILLWSICLVCLHVVSEHSFSVCVT